MSKFVARGPRAVKRLEGITSFTFFPSVLGKRILVTGEYHRIKEQCPQSPDTYQFHTWVRDLGDAAPECLDVLTEVGTPAAAKPGQQTVFWAEGVPVGAHRYNDLMSYDSPIAALNAVYADCLAHTEEVHATCAGAMTRYHGVDLRTDTLLTAPLISLFLARGQDVFIHPAVFDPALLRTLLEVSIGRDVSTRSREIFNETLRSWCSNAGIPFNAREFKNYLDYVRLRLKKRIAKLDPRVSADKIYDAIIRFAIENRGHPALSQNYIAVFTIAMDAYAILRVFTLFERTKMSRGPTGCRGDGNRYMRNVVYHCGDFHATVFRFVLATVFDADAAIAILPAKKWPETPKSCIDLPKAFDFFV